jgi:hypothetical protein
MQARLDAERKKWEALMAQKQKEWEDAMAAERKKWYIYIYACMYG